jgi:hypothetical protein
MSDSVNGHGLGAPNPKPGVPVPHPPRVAPFVPGRVAPTPPADAPPEGPDTTGPTPEEADAEGSNA